MQKLDGVFDGDNMIAVFSIYFVDDGGKRRCLSRSRRPGEQHNAVLKLGNVAQLRRQIQAIDRWYVSRNDSHHHRNRTALLEYIDPKPHTAGDRISNIRGSGLNEPASRIGITLHQRHRNYFSLIGGEVPQPFDLNRSKPSVDFDLWRPAHGKVQIRNVVGHRKHLVEDWVKFEKTHPCLQRARGLFGEACARVFLTRGLGAIDAKHRLGAVTSRYDKNWERATVF